jgi:hypothetical protein
MSDYSGSPLDVLLTNQQKGYVGLHIEQGVPVLDRDLNLLHDLITATVRSVITRYIGNGIPAGADGFAIQALPSSQSSQDFLITFVGGAGDVGTCLVGGIQVTMTAPVTYKGQAGLPPLTTPSSVQPDPRTDTVYLDVSFIEVDGTTDPDLNNSLDVGMQTSVRLKPVWVVRVIEGAPVPAAPAGHVYYSLAQLRRPRGRDTIDATMITDLRQSRLTVSDIERRLSLVEKLLLLPAFISPPVPQFLPKSGIINQAVTLNGSNFNIGSVEVRFGNVAAAIVGAPSATQIVVRVPPGLTPAGTPAGVKITISNPAGSDTSDDVFTALPAPAFTEPGGQLTPNHGTPGQPITIRGFNFNTGNVQVQFGTTSATLVGSATANQIVVQTPTGLVPAGSNTADFRITVATNSGTVVSDDLFKAEINFPAPSFVAPPLAQFLPKSGVGGQTVTLNGQNFNFAPVSVRFDTVNAMLSGSPSATQIAAVVPAAMVAAGAAPRGVKITVTTAGGSVVSADTFTVTGP